MMSGYKELDWLPIVVFIAAITLFGYSLNIPGRFFSHDVSPSKSAADVPIDPSDSSTRRIEPPNEAQNSIGRADVSAQDASLPFQLEQSRSAKLAEQLAAAQKAAIDSDGKFQTAQNHTASLMKELAAAKDDLRTNGLQEALNAEKVRARDLESNLGKARSAAASSHIRLHAAELHLSEISAELSQARGQADRATALQKALDDAQSHAVELEQKSDDLRDNVARFAELSAQLETEKQQSRTLADRLATSDAAKTHSDAVQKQLSDAQARAAGLERDLAQARQRLTASERANDDLPAMRKRADDLDAQVSAAQIAASEVEGVRKELAGGRARLVELERDLKDARIQGARAADLEAKLQAEQRHAAELGTQLAAASKTAGQATTLQDQLSQEQTRSTSLDHDLTEAKAGLAAVEAQLHVRDQQIASFGERFKDAKKNSGQTVLLQNQISEEQQRSARLNNDLTAARTKLANLTEIDARLHDAQVGIEAKLQAEQKRSADLDTRLAAAQKSAAQLGALQAALALAQTQSSSLDRDLTAARATAAAKADIEAKLQAKQKRSVDLDTRLAAAQKSAAQLGALQTELSGTKTRISDLERDLVSAQGRAAGMAGLQAKLNAEQKRAVDLDAELTANRANAAIVESLQRKWAGQLAFELKVPGDFFEEKQARAHLTAAFTTVNKLDAERKHTENLTQQLAAVQQAVEKASRATKNSNNDKGSAASRRPAANSNISATSAQKNGASKTLPALSPALASPLGGNALPEPGGMSPANVSLSDLQNKRSINTSTHVIVRYAGNNPAARNRASDLKAVLQEQGWDVGEPVAAIGSLKNNRVLYYYGEDQSNAERISNIVDILRTVQGRLSMREPLPRPGTVEIGIAEAK